MQATDDAGETTDWTTALLCIVGLDADPAPRRRGLWRDRADVEAIVGRAVVAELIDAGLAEEWTVDGRPQLVPTPRGAWRLGVTTAERARVELEYEDEGPRASFRELLERLYYRPGTDVSGGHGLAWSEKRPGRRVLAKRKRPRRIQRIVEEDYWDYPGPAAEASPRVPTRRGVYRAEEDLFDGIPGREPDPAEAAGEADEPPPEMVELVVMGRTVLVPKGGRIDRLMQQADAEGKPYKGVRRVRPDLSGGLGRVERVG
jgi:hypothetical protein